MWEILFLVNYEVICTSDSFSPPDCVVQVSKSHEGFSAIGFPWDLSRSGNNPWQIHLVGVVKRKAPATVSHLLRLYSFSFFTTWRRRYCSQPTIECLLQAACAENIKPREKLIQVKKRTSWEPQIVKTPRNTIILLS